MASKIERTAIKILAKWMRKGNMARAMRDYLPSSGLSPVERNQVAEIVHTIVRFKKLYDFALAEMSLPRTPENYLRIFKDENVMRSYQNVALEKGLYDIYFSSSIPVARILRMYPNFAEIINREPETHLSVNLSRVSRRDVLAILREEGMDSWVCRPETCVATQPHARYSSVIRSGLAIVQDSSSQHLSKLVASLGESVLDFCAGSGGKSFTVKFFNPNARVSVHDKDEKKLEALFRRAEILGLHFSRFDFKDDFDVVLVDAPCSGIGSAARNPEAKYREDIDSFPPIQMSILNSAKSFVKKDGYLVYAVCTFNPDETYLLMDKFLKQNPEFEPLHISSKGIVVNERIGGYFVSGDVIYFSVLRRT